MTRSRLAREARRRPEMDLLAGPFEAATVPAADHAADAEEPAERPIGSLELSSSPEEPAWREDG